MFVVFRSGGTPLVTVGFKQWWAFCVLFSGHSELVLNSFRMRS